MRVALRPETYALHVILPRKVDPLVNVMKVEKVADSTYEMIGGLDKQIQEIKEVLLCTTLLSKLISSRRLIFFSRLAWFLRYFLFTFLGNSILIIFPGH